MSTGYVISPHVRAVLQDDGGVVISVTKGLCYSINKTGARVWSLIREGRSRDEIINEIARELGVANGRAETDIVRFIDVLTKEDLLMRI